MNTLALVAVMLAGLEPNQLISVYDRDSRGHVFRTQVFAADGKGKCAPVIQLPNPVAVDSRGELHVCVATKSRNIALVNESPRR